MDDLTYFILDIMDLNPMGIVQQVHTANFGSNERDTPTERPDDYPTTVMCTSEIAALAFCLSEGLIGPMDFKIIYPIILRDGLYSQFN
jgi:hypothetical protein